MNDRVVIVAQLGLSFLFIVGYFLTLALFMLGYANVPEAYKEAFVGFLGVCTGSVVTIVAFWFNRTRTTAEPSIDPQLQKLMEKLLAAQPRTEEQAHA